MDLLDRLLASLEVRVNAFAICKVPRGWSLVLDGVPAPLLHYVLKGSGILRLEGGAAIPFDAHHFIILPPGRQHVIEEPNGTNLQEIGGMAHAVALADGLLAVSTPGQEHTEAQQILTACGTVEATYSGSLGLFDGFKEPVAVRLDEGEPLRRAVEAFLAELSSPSLGTRALAEALMKQCLILLVRRMAQENASQSGWLFGAADPRLVGAVLAMLENPAGDHSLASLAASTGMSRSGLAARFVQTFGHTPIEFLKKIRLQQAARLLERTDIPIRLVASSIGYESRTYFSRAFRGQFGVEPRRYRAERR